MAKRRQPAVKRRPARKKKRDPTVAIILFVGIGFLALAAGVYFVSTQKAPKVAKKKKSQPVDVVGEEPTQRKLPPPRPKSKPQPATPLPGPEPDPEIDLSPVLPRPA
jgi:type IV secretory pathway VirB10-like protein